MTESTPPVSRVVPPEPRPRLQELARGEAAQLHYQAFKDSWMVDDGEGDETRGHREPENSCPHPDCVLVRSDLAASSGEEPSPSYYELAVRMQAAEAERETARQQLHEAQDELAAMKLDETWTPAEHQRTVAAIQQSEGLDAHHYPSFRERVWWKAFESECDAARQQLADLIADLRVIQQFTGQTVHIHVRNGAADPRFDGRATFISERELAAVLARHAGKE